ncbi:MAG: GDP-mannose 4,6-dehydratase [Candidatus Omnitrophica bacterium]|nr:GDP-mannose 4,6-dehydratase [Candidatus Omnitrophota bacterium]
MKYLITGASGFVAKHFIRYLFKTYDQIDVAATDKNNLEDDYLKRVDFYQGSLIDKEFVLSLIKEIKPDYIVHLAAYSSVAKSWQKPIQSFQNNVNIFLNLLESIRDLGSKARILSVGSSEEYGMVTEKDLPLDEEERLNPISPYAVARVSQEHISQVYAQGYKLQIICTRSFNHLGPYQPDLFVVSSLAKQVVEAKLGKREKIISGNLDIIRDFIDVRDVTKAYDLLLHKGKIGQIYNVCSGKGYKLADILAKLQNIAEVNIPGEKNPELIRPVDNPVIIGSPEKIEELGFKRKYKLNQSLADIITYWENKLNK